QLLYLRVVWAFALSPVPANAAAATINDIQRHWDMAFPPPMNRLLSGKILIVGRPRKAGLLWTISVVVALYSRTFVRGGPIGAPGSRPGRPTASAHPRKCARKCPRPSQAARPWARIRRSSER